MGCGSSVGIGQPLPSSPIARRSTMMQNPTAEAMMHTRILGSRYDLGEKVMCHVQPEGWIEGSIVKRDFEETAYHIQLAYNGEMVACPVDSDWYVRKDMPDAASLIVMEANKKDKPRRYPVGEYVYCCVDGPAQWMEAQVLGLNLDNGRYPYRVQMASGREILITNDSPAYIRKQNSPKKLALAGPLPRLVTTDCKQEGGFCEVQIVDSSKPSG